MPKIIHNGVEYGGGGYSKRQIDEKLKLKLSKSSIDTVLSDDSINPVQNKVVTKALNDKISQVKIMPTSATDGVAVLFTGTTTADYKQGHVYQYSETDAVWVDITDAVIENVDSLPEKNIKDIFYRIGGGEWVTKIVALSPDPDDTIEQLEAIGFTVLKDHYQESTNTRDVSFKGDNNHFGYVSHSYLYRIGIINATWNLSSGKYIVEGTGNDGHVSIVILGSERKEDANFRVLAQNELWAGDSETQTIRRVAWNDEVTIQYEIMPTPSENELGKIVQYVGETTGSYIKGFFYRCAEVSDTDPTEYEWVNQEVQESTGDGTPHWSGTRAEYEAIKDSLEAGTIVNITDDYDDGLEVVDVIEDGNMNPVTSNAVAKITSHDLSTLTWNTTYIDLGTWTTGGVLEKCGIVQFTKIFSVKAGIPSGTIICSGLPKPAMAAEIPVAWDGDSAMGGFFLNTNGDLASWATVTANTNCRINLVYIKA